MTFTRFNELLGKHQEVGAWHFAPSVLQVQIGQSFTAVNRGGEEHTFTEVEEFGGGVVPELNEASGNPVPAPECLAITPEDRLTPGETDTDEAEETGTEFYQCCIHPWMRTTVTVR